jgi:hypothetical protein
MRSLEFGADRMLYYNEPNLLFPNARAGGRLNDWAAQQIGSRLDAPGAEWLWKEKHCPSDLAATILNDLVQRRDPAKYLIRLKGSTIRAVLSDQYTRFDNAEMIDLAVQAIDTMGLEPEVKRAQVGDDMSAYILFPQATIENDPRSKGGRDGRLHPAIHISNSERGGGSAKITGAVFSHYCQNGLITGWSSTEVMAVRHRFISSPAMGALVAQSIASGLEMSEAAARAFVASQEVRIPKPDLSGITASWARRYGLSINQRDSWLDAITGELNRNERQEDPRLFDVVNGATWLAQEISVADSVLVERMAGDLLTSYIPLRPLEAVNEQ